MKSYSACVKGRLNYSLLCLVTNIISTKVLEILDGNLSFFFRIDINTILCRCLGVFVGVELVQSREQLIIQQCVAREIISKVLDFFVIYINFQEEI